ncbi:hypothetical protein R1sor_018026 [Riccia sorocarpa]|uniref:Uncharacterized protein n=1 Tax=Riccia sorocarpa TaxID=122646 RepID=A0ABD3IBT8_9MARC
MATSITRLRYPSYRGKESEDPDAFVEEFNQIASANREAQDDDKLRIFSALLKGRGSRWVAALAPAEKATWTCRLGPQGTIAEVIATAEKYETARWSARVRKHKSKKASYSSSEEEETSTIKAVRVSQMGLHPGDLKPQLEGRSKKPRKGTLQKSPIHLRKKGIRLHRLSGNPRRTRVRWMR